MYPFCGTWVSTSEDHEVSEIDSIENWLTEPWISRNQIPMVEGGVSIDKSKIKPPPSYTILEPIPPDLSLNERLTCNRNQKIP